MQLIDSTDVSHERRAPDNLRPGLDVSVLTLASPGERSEIHLSVRGGSGPVRLYVYVDGDLVDSHVLASERSRIPLSGLSAGRHAVTARAIDAAGRWGGASIVLTTD
jgi:hypothetical protein